MELRPLGRTGVQVSPLCLGAMMFGEWGTKDHDDSTRIIHRALDAGINFIDTADVYSAGESEEIVGEAIAGQRDDIVLATKVHMPMGESPNRREQPALDRRRTRTPCGGSAQTGSTSTRSTATTLPSTSTSPSAPSPTLSTLGRSATSGTPPGRPRPSSKPSGPPNAERWTGPGPSNHLLGPHPGHRTDVLPTWPATATASSPTAPSPAGGSPAATARANSRPGRSSPAPEPLRPVPAREPAQARCRRSSRPAGR